MWLIPEFNILIIILISDLIVFNKDFLRVYIYILKFLIYLMLWENLKRCQTSKLHVFHSFIIKYEFCTHEGLIEIVNNFDPLKNWYEFKS